MMTTFLIEGFLALWTLIKYRQTVVGKLVIIILLLLSTFQLAEYVICTTTLSNLLWTKIGLVAITFLPTAGVHLFKKLIEEEASRFNLAVIYLPAIIFALIFTFLFGAIGDSTCAGNYVIFDTNPLLSTLYSLYYLGYLFWVIGRAIIEYRSAKIERIKYLITWTIIGYLAFMLPTAMIHILSEESRQAIPSIMCGFALLLALILTFKVLPLTQTNSDK